LLLFLWLLLFFEWHGRIWRGPPKWRIAACVREMKLIRRTRTRDVRHRPREVLRDCGPEGSPLGRFPFRIEHEIKCRVPRILAWFDPCLP
jgi:hypothetical protein